MSHALFCGLVGSQEARVSMGLKYSPDPTGLREIEVSSGLSVHTLLAILPQAGFSSDLLTCRTRGVFTWEPKDRRPMVFEHRSLPHHNETISLQDLEDLRSEGSYKGDGDEDQNDGAGLTGVLDPSLDLWSNKAGRLGDAGWVLAMVTQLKAMTFTLGELERILGLGERQLRRFLGRLGTMATKTKTGRTVTVTVDMSILLADDLSTSRKAARSRTHQEEASAVQAMATEVGRTAKEMWKNRLAEVRQLREYLRQIPALARIRHRVEMLIGILSPQQPRRWSGERQIRQYLTTYQERL